MLNFLRRKYIYLIQYILAKECSYNGALSPKGTHLVISLIDTEYYFWYIVSLIGGAF